MFANSIGGIFDYTTIEGNMLSTRPSGTAGAAITPGASNSYGSYTQVLSALSNEVFGLWIMIHTGSTAGSARDMIATVGIDPAGGSSYTDTINHLLCGCSGPFNNGGVQYFFPLRIAAGSTVAVKASVNDGTAGSVRVIMQAYGRPQDRRIARHGSRIETVGATTASSNGTAVTPGTTSEGSWTDLGALTNDAWWVQCGFGVNNAAMTFVQYYMDLAVGDASNKRILLQDILVATTGSETVNWSVQPGGMQAMCKAGEHIYGRLQCSGTADTGISMAAYALS